MTYLQNSHVLQITFAPAGPIVGTCVFLPLIEEEGCFSTFQDPPYPGHIVMIKKLANIYQLQFSAALWDKAGNKPHTGLVCKRSWRASGSHDTYHTFEQGNKAVLLFGLIIIFLHSELYWQHVAFMVIFECVACREKKKLHVVKKTLKRHLPCSL